MRDGYMKLTRMLEKKKNGNVRASHILISYKGSQNAAPSIEISKNDAKIEPKCNKTRAKFGSFFGARFQRPKKNNNGSS